MQTAQYEEDKRNKIWQGVMIGATTLIIVVVVFFLYKGFFGNPIEGTWMQDESSMTLKISGKENAVLTWDELFEGKELKVNLKCTLNKTEKQITFKVEQKELDEAAERIKEDPSMVESAISSVLTSFNYNLEGNELTLTEWDYGNQLVFTKIK